MNPNFERKKYKGDQEIHYLSGIESLLQKKLPKEGICQVDLSYRDPKHSFGRLNQNKMTSVEELLVESVVNTTQPEATKKILKKVPIELKKLDRIDELDLSNNEIKELPEWLMDYSRSMDGLYLASNKLGELPALLKRFGALEDLDLSDNAITEISETAFLNTNLRIRSLNLSRNELESIDFHVFNLRHLESIDLSFNKIENSVSLDYFRGNPKLKRVGLDFWGTLYNELDFTLSPNLEYLSLAGNHIGHHIDEGYHHLEELGVFKLSKLKVLSLSCNSLNFIPGAIGNLKMLDMLWLEDNKLTQLPESIFELPYLKSVFLEDNDFSAKEKGYIKDKFKGNVKVYF